MFGIFGETGLRHSDIEEVTEEIAASRLLLF